MAADEPGSTWLSIARWRPEQPPALRYPGFRNFWLGMLAAIGGFQMFQNEACADRTNALATAG